jgi:nucleoside-diphosphate-sugar epimerase
MKILICGAGYTGSRLGHRLRQEGHTVTAWVRSPESASALEQQGWNVIAADLADPEAWERMTPHDAVVYGPSTSGGGVEGYRALHETGVALALARHPDRPFLYVSSTSVYGQTDGSWVDESSPAEPSAATARILRTAEDRVLARNGTVARVAGIYGPGRGVLFRKVLDGTAVLDGDGSRWINQIHVDDLVSALVHLFGHSRAPGAVWNIADAEPVTQRDFYAWICRTFSRPFPPVSSGPVERKRGNTNKRVSSARLTGLGWIPRYPTYREGYSAIGPA